jgi:hypothetical protein
LRRRLRDIGYRKLSGDGEIRRDVEKVCHGAEYVDMAYAGSKVRVAICFRLPGGT